MEKSHYQARGVFFKNTCHGGGRVCSNYLKEMFNWFFWCTFGRNVSKEITQKSTLAKVLRRQQQLRPGMNAQSGCLKASVHSHVGSFGANKWGTSLFYAEQRNKGRKGTKTHCVPSDKP